MSLLIVYNTYTDSPELNSEAARDASAKLRDATNRAFIISRPKRQNDSMPSV